MVDKKSDGQSSSETPKYESKNSSTSSSKIVTKNRVKSKQKSQKSVSSKTSTKNDSKKVPSKKKEKKDVTGKGSKKRITKKKVIKKSSSSISPALSKKKESTNSKKITKKVSKTIDITKNSKERLKDGLSKASNESPFTEPIQPEMNIGLVGHVDHGKTTLTERFSGKWTDTHSEEIKRGITIRLGYADTVFRKCSKCKGDSAYTTKTICPEHQVQTKPLMKVSFVDAPGHESLMATMLSGATIMDGALLLIAANEFCPQPQTKEHIMALEISGIDKILVVQNKIDLVSKERAIRNYNQIKEFLKGTKYSDAPIVPISAQRGVNLDVLIRVILNTFKSPKRNLKDEPLLVVARSFDINKPGTKPENLKGGVLGGALKQGILKQGERVEIRPGRIVEEANKIKAKPLFTNIISLVTGGQSVKEIKPGGSVALMTSLDHGVVRADSLTGSVVGRPGTLPPIWYAISLDVTLLQRLVGTAEEMKVNPIAANEILMLNVNSAATVGVVSELSKKRVICKLKKPICASIGSRITISRRVGTRFRLIGYGILQDMKK